MTVLAGLRVSEGSLMRLILKVLGKDMKWIQLIQKVTEFPLLEMVFKTIDKKITEEQEARMRHKGWNTFLFP